MTQLVVFCADVGSVSGGNFGWARSATDEPGGDSHDTAKPSDLATAVAAELKAKRPVALGFECPLFVPVPADEFALGKARAGEGNRSWSAGAGTGALATGLVQAAWVLRAVREECPDDELHLDWNAFTEAGSGLLVWEAFVSAEAKGGSHVDDAAIAVAAFVDALPDVRAVSTIDAEHPLSLIGAVAEWSGWGDGALTHARPLVVRA